MARTIIVFINMLIVFAGVAIGIYTTTDPVAVEKAITQIGTENLALWMAMGFILFALFIIILAFGPLIINSIRNTGKKKHLARCGVKTMARIIDIQDTGITVNKNPAIKITVELNGVLGSFQSIVSRVNIPRIGDIIEVIYDPADPSCVMPAFS